MKNFFHMVTCAKAKLMDGKLQRVSARAADSSTNNVHF